MESSTKKFSKNKFVSKKENDIFVQGLRMEPGLYFSKNRIRVAIPFNADDPQVIQAFRENKMISQKIVTQAGQWERCQDVIRHLPNIMSEI